MSIGPPLYVPRFFFVFSCLPKTVHKLVTRPTERIRSLNDARVARR